MTAGHTTKKAGRKRPWYYKVEAKDPVTGQRKQQWSKGYKTQTDARKALREALHQMDNGTYVPASKQTLGDYLTTWLQGHKTTVKATTWASYEVMVNRQVIPRIGAIPLKDLSASHLNKLYSELQENGRMDGKGGLSPTSVKYVHTIIRKALSDAVEEGILARNAAKTRATKPPAAAKTEIDFWTRAELRSFLTAVADDRLLVAYRLLSHTGCRRGELLALKWSDVEWDNERIQFRRSLVPVGYQTKISTPKNGKGRPVDLDPETMAVLRRWQTQQKAERLAWGPGYNDDGLIVCRENGEPIHPHTMTRTFEKATVTAGVRTIKLHDLRHTHATILLEKGIHPKVVQERLGHSSVAITIDTYSGQVPSMGKEAAALFAAAVQ